MLIISLIALTLLWINAEPLIWLKRLYFREENYNTYSNKRKAMHRLAYCALCSGFYIGLFTGSALLAAIVAVGSELTQRILNKLS